MLNIFITLKTANITRDLLKLLLCVEREVLLAEP